MLSAVTSTMIVMGWLGLVLLCLIIANTLCGTINNVFFKGENFDIKKLLKGLGRSLIFYVSAAFTCVAFSMLPSVNTMVSDLFETTLLSNDLLTSMSSVGVLGVVISTITIQGKKAIDGITKLANASTSNEDK